MEASIVTPVLSSEPDLAHDPSIEAVEIKVTLREQDEEAVQGTLGLADAEAESRRVYFFDTRGLDLFESGIVLRARLVRDGADDSTVKLRPIVPAELDERWQRLEGFEIELDAVGESSVCSAKLTVEQRRDEIAEAAAGARPLRKLFSDEQERLLEEYAPAGVSWDELAVLGPIEVRRWEVEPEGFPHEITVEEWVLPGGRDLVELSIKVEPSVGVAAAAELDAFMTEHDLAVDPEQQTKTRSALALLARAS